MSAPGREGLCPFCRIPDPAILLCDGVKGQAHPRAGQIQARGSSAQSLHPENKIQNKCAPRTQTTQVSDGTVAGAPPALPLVETCQARPKVQLTHGEGCYRAQEGTRRDRGWGVGTRAGVWRNPHPGFPVLLPAGRHTAHLAPSPGPPHPATKMQQHMCSVSAQGFYWSGAGHGGASVWRALKFQTPGGKQGLSVHRSVCTKNLGSVSHPCRLG